MKRLLLALIVAVAVATGIAITAPAANSYGYNCAIQDPPPTPYQSSGYLYGSARTVCLSPAYKLQVVVCLVRYPSQYTTSGSPQGCTTATAYYSSGLTGYANAHCDYTTYLYTWRTEAYAIATINGGTFKSPVVLSNPLFRYCA